MNKPTIRLHSRPVRLALRILPILLCCCGAARGQDEASVQLQFVSFPRTSNPEPVELRIGESEFMKVELPSNSLSQVYRVRPQSLWALGKSGEGEGGKKTFAVYGQAASISSNTQLIIVVRKGAADSDGFNLIPVDNGTAGFGGGSYLFMNTARVSVGGYIGNEKFTLKPGGMEIVAPKASAERGVREVSFVKIFYRSGKDEATPFFSSEWRYSDQGRTLAFVYHVPDSDRLRLHVIRDYVQATTPR